MTGVSTWFFPAIASMKIAYERSLEEGFFSRGFNSDVMAVMGAFILQKSLVAACVPFFFIVTWACATPRPVLSRGYAVSNPPNMPPPDRVEELFQNERRAGIIRTQSDIRVFMRIFGSTFQQSLVDMASPAAIFANVTIWADVLMVWGPVVPLVAIPIAVHVGALWLAGSIAQANEFYYESADQDGFSCGYIAFGLGVAWAMMYIPYAINEGHAMRCLIFTMPLWTLGLCILLRRGEHQGRVWQRRMVELVAC